MIKRDTLQEREVRIIKSFVPRDGRMTPGQRQSLEDIWPSYGLSLDAGLLDFASIFGRQAPVSLEIGFGDGKSLLNMAQRFPEQDFIGIEVYRTGIAKLLSGIKKSNLTNIRIFCADAIEVLNNCIPDSSLQLVQLFFPDPWPKARHHKRRLVQPEFVQLLRRKLVATGSFHMATDWEEYAQHMLDVMQQQDGWINLAGSDGYAPRPDTRVLTKFEQRGQKLGHGTWDLIFRKSVNI